ncbi:MAG: UDP-glucose 4-epimerase GalE [Myxococcota bacterium]
MKVLVTGGAGYIGSHVAYELVDAGHDVVILDNLSTGVRENVPEQAEFVLGDTGDAELTRRVLADEVDAVMHFAASIVVPESVERPLAYYGNNTCNTRSLLEACVDVGVDKFIFSSTAAVYGMPDEVPVDEQSPVQPINPYGWSKLMTEQMLQDAGAAHSLDYVILRYFNVAGADPEGRTGQSTPNATHLIKVASQAALGERDGMKIFGTDYDTRDGTGVRDYIHVSDLAKAHIQSLGYLDNGGSSVVLNCGYGHGFTVREVIDAVRAVSGVEFEAEPAERRAGDPPTLVADSFRIADLLGWSPEHDDLEFIVRTALDWEEKIADRALD